MKAYQRILRKFYTKYLECKSYFIVNDWFRMGTFPYSDYVTICVGIKNRSEQLLKHLIPSINACNLSEYIQLSVYDCSSTDVEDLLAEIGKIYDGDLIFSSRGEKFTRTHSFNGAVEQAEHHTIFICDADMTIPVDFVEQFRKTVDHMTMWFPICFSLHEDKPRVIHKDNGWWRTAGFGIMGLTRSLWDALGGYNEDYVTWGGEDDDMYTRVREKCVRIVRNKSKGLFHNWHPYEGFGGVQDKTTIIEKFKSLISN